MTLFMGPTWLRIKVLFNTGFYQLPPSTWSSPSTNLNQIKCEVHNMIHIGETLTPEQTRERFAEVSTFIDYRVKILRGDALPDEDDESNLEVVKIEPKAEEPSLRPAGSSQANLTCLGLLKWISWAPGSARDGMLQSQRSICESILKGDHPTIETLDFYATVSAHQSKVPGHSHRGWTPEVLEKVAQADMLAIMGDRAFVTDLSAWRQVLGTMKGNIPIIFILEFGTDLINTTRDEIRQAVQSGQSNNKKLQKMVSNWIHSETMRRMEKEGDPTMRSWRADTGANGSSE